VRGSTPTGDAGGDAGDVAVFEEKGLGGGIRA